MKNFFVTIAFLLMPIMHAQPAQAVDVMASDPSVENSIEWQKLKLQGMIEARANGILTTLTGGNEFYVRTEITTKQRRLPTGVERNSTALSLGKLDMSVEVSNLNLTEKETVFTQIERIEVVASVPKASFELNKDLIQKSLDAAVLGFSKAPIKVRVEPFTRTVKATEIKEDDKSTNDSANDSTAKTKLDEPSSKSEPFNWRNELHRQMLPLSVLLASLFLAGLIFRMSSIYRSVEARKSEAYERQASQRSQHSPSENGGSQTRPSHHLGEKGQKDSIDSVEQGRLEQQIRLVVENTPQKLMTLIRRWLASDEVSAMECLRALPTILPIDSLLKLVNQLDESNKKKWRANFDHELEEGFEARARFNIFQQLISGIMSEASVVNEEIRHFLDGIRADECAELSQKNPELGAVLSQLLTTPQVARMLSLLPEDVAGQVAIEGLSVTPDFVESKLSDLQRSLEKIRALPSNKNDSFFEKAVALLREVDPQRESILFRGYAKHFNRADVRKIANLVCPTEIIIRAPAGVHRQCLAEIPLAARADLIHAVPEKTKLILLGSYRPDEKIRELLEAELSQIDLDPQRKLRVSRTSEKLWRSYIHQFRKLAQTNDQLETILQPLLDEWVEQQVAATPEPVRVPHAA